MKKTIGFTGVLVLFFLLFTGELKAQAGMKKKQDTVQQVTPGRSNDPSQISKPYVILISADGFRYDYMEKYEATNLQRLSGAGVRAHSMVPTFPSMTFPNHYTLATGMYPAHHGLVDNSFYDASLSRRYTMSKINEVTDGSWYGGEPIWVLAEKQKMLSASFYWVGSEAAIQGIRPTYWFHYGEEIQIEERIAAVRNWLLLPEEKRPHLITFYFPEVDHAGHDFGPDDQRTADAVHFVDRSIGRMQSMIDSLQLPVNIVFVSDHGMSAVDTVNTLKIPAVDTSLFLQSIGDMMVHIYSKTKDPQQISSLYEKLKAVADGYDVYLTSKTPRRWKYNKANDRYGRIGDIILTPRYPRIFSYGNKRVIPGRHGYDPYELKDMHATFLAWGPQIKAGKQIGSFQNIHVYRLVAALLGLKVDAPTDSRNYLLKKVIRGQGIFTN